MERSYVSGTSVSPYRTALVAAVMALSPVALLAGPEGAQVVQGSAQFSQTGNYTAIEVSDKAIINYSRFDIARPETVEFIQPGANASVLNRILSANPTTIDGTLLANGRVFFVNPAGVYFGESAQVNATQLIASALDISNANFINGNFLFSGGQGSVVNEGSIHAERVYLIGTQVANSGQIECPDGYAVMAAGDRVLIRELGTDLLLEVDAPASPQPPAADAEDAAITNSGKVQVGSGKIILAAAGDIYSQAISNVGSLSASVETGAAGQIELAATGGEVTNTGTIEASGSEGGHVTMKGARVGQFGEVHADGAEGDGGRIDLWADEVVSLGSESLTTTNAGTDGDGGEVLVYSPDTAVVWEGARIEAKGGTSSGDGGFIETSGKERLFVGDVTVNAGAPAGAPGQWLLDPTDVTLSDDPTASMTGGPAWVPDGDPATGNIEISAIEGVLATNGGTVTVSTASGAIGPAGTIFVDDPIDVALGTHVGPTTSSLTLNAEDSITFDSDASLTITTSDDTGDQFTLNLYATTGVVIGAPIAPVGVTPSIVLTTTGTTFDNTGGAITTNGGAVDIQNTGDVTIGAAINAGAGSVTIDGGAGTATSIAGAGTITSSDVITLEASGNIGSAGAAIQTAVGTGTIDASTTGAGEIHIDNTGSVTLGTIATTASNVAINNTGDVSIGSVTAGGASLTISSTGAINDASVDSVTDLTAGTLDLDAAGGIGNVNPIETAAGTIDADTTAGAAHIDIDNVNAAATELTSLSTAGAGSNITVDQSGGGSLTVTSATTNDGSINITADSAAIAATLITAGGTSRSISVGTTTSGNVTIGALTTGGGITINSAGAIDDATAGMDAVTDLTAATLDLDAAGGIGSATNPIDTAATSIAADNTGAAAVDVANNQAAPTTVSSFTTVGGDLTFDQTGGGDVTFTGDVTSGGGNITLTSAAGLTIADTASVSSKPGGGGTATYSGATIDGSVQIGNGDITIIGSLLDLVITSEQISDVTINLSAPRDIIIEALLQTTAPGADIILTADDEGTPDGVGGVWVKPTGEIDSAGNVSITGSDVFATLTPSDSVVVDSDATGTQIAAVGDIDLIQPVGSTLLLGDELSAGGTITLSGPVALIGNTALTGDEVNFDNSMNGGGFGLTIQPDDATDDIQVGGVDGGQAGVLTLDDTEISRLIDNTFGQITIGRNDGSHSITVNQTSFADPLTIRTPNGGSISIEGQLDTLAGGDPAAIVLDGPGATTTLGADVITNGATITFSDAVEIADGQSITVATTGEGAAPAGAAITFDGPLDGDTISANGGEALAVDAGTGGNISFAGPVGGDQPFSLTITNCNSATFAGNVTLEELTTFARPYAVTLGGSVNSITQDTSFLNTGLTTIGNQASDSSTFAGGLDAVSAGGVRVAGTIATTNAPMDLGNTTLTADSTLKSGSGAINVASITDGGNNYTLTLQENTPTSTGAVTFAGNVTLDELITFAQPYAVALEGSLNSIDQDTSFLNTGLTTIGNGASDSSTFAGGLNAVSAGGVQIAGTVATTNAQIDLGDTTMAANSTLRSGSGAINVASITDGANSYTLALQDATASGAVTFEGDTAIHDLDTFAGPYAVAFHGPGTIIDTDTTFLNTGIVTLGDGGDVLMFDGGLDTFTSRSSSETVVAGTVQTSNDPIDFGVLTLTGDSIISAGTGAVNFHGPVDDDGDAGTSSTLAVNSSGSIRLDAPMGATDPLTAISLRATGDLVINDPVTATGGGVSLVSDGGRIYTEGAPGNALDVAITGYSDAKESHEAAIVIDSRQSLVLGPGAVLTANGQYYGGSADGLPDDRESMNLEFKEPEGGNPLDVAIYLRAGPKGSLGGPFMVKPDYEDVTINSNGIHIAYSDDTHIGALVVDAADTVTFGPAFEAFLESLGSELRRIEVVSRITRTLDDAATWGTLPHAGNLNEIRSWTNFENVDYDKFFSDQAYPGYIMYLPRGETDSDPLAEELIPLPPAPIPTVVTVGADIAERAQPVVRMDSIQEAEAIVGELKMPHPDCMSEDQDDAAKCQIVRDLFATDVTLDLVARRIVALDKTLGDGFARIAEPFGMLITTYPAPTARNILEIERTVQADETLDRWMTDSLELVQILVFRLGRPAQGSTELFLSKYMRQADRQSRTFMRSYISARLAPRPVARVSALRGQPIIGPTP